MYKTIGVLAIVASLFLFLVRLPSLGAETTSEYSVQLSVTTQTAPPGLRLSWPPDRSTQPIDYAIYRKAPESAFWGRPTVLPGTSTGYLDTNISIGTAYEYEVVKTTHRYNGYGYICAGVEVPAVEDRGRL